MNYKIMLNDAIEYAINSNFSAYNKPGEIWDRLHKAKNICLFGVGKYYRDIVNKNFFEKFFRDINPIKYVSDNNCDNCDKEYITNIKNAKFISIDELVNLEDAIVLITVGNNRKDIQKQLDKLGVENYVFGDLYLREYDSHYSSNWFYDNKSKILEVFDMLEDDKSKEIYTNVFCNRVAPHLSNKNFNDMKEENEYFNTGIFKLTDNEYIADCGAFIGDSLEEYYKLKNGRLGGYYCFELDHNNAEICNKKIKEYNKDNIILFRVGVSNEHTFVNIDESYGTSSRINDTDETGITAEIVKLDDALKGKKVSYIKMDIEGAEIAALEGAENIIKMQKPKLAISAYHYLSDLWEIPLLIKSFNKDYKIFMRHHTADVFDTDCYAYIEE